MMLKPQYSVTHVPPLTQPYNGACVCWTSIFGNINTTPKGQITKGSKVMKGWDPKVVNVCYEAVGPPSMGDMMLLWTYVFGEIPLGQRCQGPKVCVNGWCHRPNVRRLTPAKGLNVKSPKDHWLFHLNALSP